MRILHKLSGAWLLHNLCVSIKLDKSRAVNVRVIFNSIDVVVKHHGCRGRFLLMRTVIFVPYLIFQVHRKILKLLKSFLDPLLEFIKLLPKHAVLLGYDLSIVLFHLETSIVPILNKMSWHIPDNWAFGQKLNVVPGQHRFVPFILRFVELLNIANVYFPDIIVINTRIHYLFFIIKQIMLTRVKSSITNIKPSQKSNRLVDNDHFLVMGPQ